MSELIGVIGEYNPFEQLEKELKDKVRRVMFLTGPINVQAPTNQERIDEVSGPKAVKRVAVLGREVARDRKPVCRIEIP